MVRHECAGTLFACIAVMSIGGVIGCGSNVPLGTEYEDAAQKDSLPGTGGSTTPGAGGAVGAGGTVGGAGGALGGAGGASVDAPVAQGGSGGVGGSLGTGGLPGGGGMGTGGAGGAAAGTSGQQCGTIVGLTCGAGQFCDLQSQCGRYSDAAGTCYPSGGVCTTDWNPVCGCDGKTYSNECDRRNARVERAYVGACPDGGVGGVGGSGTGGRSGSGGAGGTSTLATGTGGIPGSGGNSGTGGTTGVDGGTGQLCGGFAGLPCPTGQFCDMSSHCGAIADASGTCQPTGGGCIAVWLPVCGCDGKTYPSDCDRMSAGVLKASDGECPKTDGGATVSLRRRN